MLRICSSSLAMRASLSLPCCESSCLSSSMRRRASSSSKSPAVAGSDSAAMQDAAAAMRAATARDALFTRVLDVRASVLRPGRLVVAHGRRLLLAVAHGLDGRVGSAEHGHHLLHRFGTALAECEVVFAAAALVAVALDAHMLASMVGDVARVRLHQ